MLTTCPVAAFIMVPGSWQQCNPMTSAAAPWAAGMGKMGVVHLLHHQADAQHVLHSDFALLGSRAVDD